MNATQQNNLPDTDFNLIALAPWYNDTCTLSYLKSTTYDPIRAFLFYIPDGSTALPPPPEDPIWDLSDTDVPKWKKTARYPIYAIPGALGAQLMTALSEYSGNVTSVPYGRTLVDHGVHPSSYVRIYTEIGIENSIRRPDLWRFFLVVLGVLILVLVITVVARSTIQRARRSELEQKIRSGEVNLEALGIQRLTVSTDVIESMPLYVYVDHLKALRASRTSLDSTHPSTIYTIQNHALSTKSSHDSIIPKQDPYIDDILAQSACTICYKDYQPNVTTIRELSCGHIFHPDCIDPHLFEVSSLCPVCKKSVFPLGTCPVKITNWMVHHERAIRGLRTRITVFDADVEEGDENKEARLNWNLQSKGPVLKIPARLAYIPLSRNRHKRP